MTKNVSECDQEISQSHTANHPTALCGRAKEHRQSQDIRKTKLSNHLSLPRQDDCETRKDTMLCITNKSQNRPHKNKWDIRESPPQFENRIMARVYVRRIMRRTNTVLCTKKRQFVSQK